MSRRAIALGIALVAVVGLGVGLWMVVVDRLHADRALPGVTVEGQDVGGLDARALAARAEAIAAPVLSRPVTVRAGTIESTNAAADLGMRPLVDQTVTAAFAVGRAGPVYARLWQRVVLIKHPIDIAITYAYDPAVARAAIARVVRSIVADPKDAAVTVVEGRLVVTSPSRDGVVVDEPASVALVLAALERREGRVELAVEVHRPAFATEDAERMAEPVARFTTRFPYNPDRIHNIRLAAASLRGLLLPPDAVLSYNRVVGPRDPARGYRKAPVLVNDILVPGDGGGVCQVSSTLFNAALLAEMAVEARTNHSQPVPYLQAGRDATVDYGNIDLRLRNATGHHLYLWTEVGPRTLTFTVFGARPPGKEVGIVVTDRVWIPAPTHTVTKRDPLLPVGMVKIDAPKPGLRARTLRIIRQDSQVVREELVALNYYKPVPRTIRIGAKEIDAEQAVRRPPAP